MTSDSESTAKADTPAEEQFNADSNEEQIDLDEEDSEDGPASVYSPEDDETSGSEA